MEIGSICQGEKNITQILKDLPQGSKNSKQPDNLPISNRAPGQNDQEEAVNIQHSS
jgi:hypothetical protein